MSRMTRQTKLLNLKSHTPPPGSALSLPNSSLIPTALLIIDLQEGLAKSPTAHGFNAVAARAGQLASAFRAIGQPVVLVAVEGGGSKTFVDELGQRPGDQVFTKMQRSALHENSALVDELARLGIEHVVIAGFATSRGVAATVADAVKLGLRVTVADDAVTDSTTTNHESAIASLQGVATVRLVADITTELRRN